MHGVAQVQGLSQEIQNFSNIMVYPMQELEDCRDELLDDTKLDRPKQILEMLVTKKVSTTLDAMISLGALKSYHFLDTKLIVLKGILEGRAIKVLFDS